MSGFTHHAVVGGVRYEWNLHTTSDGLEIFHQLARLGAEPLGRLVAGVTSSNELLEQFADLLGDDDSDRDLVETLAPALQRIDWAQLGGDLAHALQGVATAQLVRDILRHVHVAGQAVGGDPLWESHWRGRYLDMHVLAARVCSSNGFFPELPTFSAGVARAPTTAGAAA